MSCGCEGSDLGERRAEDPEPSWSRPAPPAGRRAGPADRGDERVWSLTTLGRARSGSATSLLVPVTWSPSTASTSATSKVSGPVWQLTAVDTATRWAICQVFLGPSNTDIAKRFLDLVIRKLRRLGVKVTGVLTDNGPEFGARFDAHLESSASRITAPRRDHRTTTPCANDSKAPRCRNAGGPRSTADASTGSGNSAPRSTLGSSATTPADPTTATTWPAAHHAKSSTNTARTEHHDHNQQGPSVTSTRGPEGLVNEVRQRGGSRRRSRSKVRVSPADRTLRPRPCGGRVFARMR